MKRAIPCDCRQRDIDERRGDKRLRAICQVHDYYGPDEVDSAGRWLSS